MSNHLFVYGTLRPASGHHLAEYLVANARHAGPATIAGRLYDLGHFPGLADAAAADDLVHGDLFELPYPEPLLSVLDAYEGDLFRREQREVASLDGQRLLAWVYVYQGSPSDGVRIASGDVFDPHAAGRVFEPRG
jgi:gamma-glutamylcyclotransferase (GGCT)/AIG2-like uncharacterized protein YtfP